MGTKKRDTKQKEVQRFQEGQLGRKKSDLQVLQRIDQFVSGNGFKEDVLYPE